MSDPADMEQLARSLDAVIDLLEGEIERLKVELETFRLGEHPERAALMRDRVRRIDQREDRLEELRRLVAAAEELLREPDAARTGD